MKKLAIAMFAAAAFGFLVQSAAVAGPMMQASSKPNGSGVSLNYRIEGTPKVGQPTTITLSFAGVVDPEGAEVRFSSDPELVLDAATPARLSLPRGGPAALTLVVTPTAEGRFYVNVFTAQRGAKSAVSVPVQVGERRTAAPFTSPGEPEPVIVMPAE